MIIELFRWWYSAGWVAAVKRIRTRTTNVAHAFSTGALLKTLFSPWRRVVTVGGRTLDDKIKGAIDNMVSRIVGFFSRLVVLLAALIMVSGSFLLSLAIVIIWPLIPLLAFSLIIKGLV